MASRVSDMQNAAALSFENDVQYRTIEQCIPGASRVLATGMSSDLPMNNADACFDMMIEQGQMNHVFIAQLARLASGQATLGYALRRKIDDTMIAAGASFLSFAAITPALTRYPKDDDDYEFFRASVPQIPEDDVVLIPNSGLLLSTPWTEDEVGQLFIRSAAQRSGTQTRWYRGSSFSGAGNRVANFANIGADLRGKVINPQPTSAGQILVSAPGLLTETDDYTVSFSGGIATVTFLSDIASDKTVIFKIEGTAS